MNKIMIVMCVVGLLVTSLMVFLLARGQRVDDEEPVAATISPSSRFRSSTPRFV